MIQLPEEHISSFNKLPYDDDFARRYHPKEQETKILM